MSNYYVRARKRGTIDFRKAVVWDDYFGEHKPGYQFVNEYGVPSGEVFRTAEVHVAGEWVNEKGRVAL